ncbi:MAG TPA: PQQ-binding-like beta-propeller repeat protein [Longimicrobium sp.]|jgi:outer membrane protein assembly factor BamB
MRSSLTLLAAVCLLGGCDSVLRPEEWGNVQQLWRTPYSHDYWFDGIPAVEGERVFGGIAGDAVALDAGTGAVLWRTRVRGTNTSLATRNLLARDGQVYLAEADAVYSLDGATGAVRWRVRLPEQTDFARSALDERAFYVGSWGRRVYALARADGAVLWSADLGPDWPATANPRVNGITAAGDTLYVSAQRTRVPNTSYMTGLVIALEARTGREIWRYEGPDPKNENFILAPPAVAGSRVLAVEGGRLAFAVALDRATGRELWRTPLAGSSGIDHELVVAGGVAYGGSSDTYVYAFDVETGRILWRRGGRGSSIHELAACGGWLLAGGLGLNVFDRASGRELAALVNREEDFITSGFAVQGDRFFAFSTAAVYAFRCR